MIRAFDTIIETFLFFSIVLFCTQSLSAVKLSEAKLGNEGLKQVQERMTPEIYVFGAEGELKLRAIGYDEETFNDLISVFENGQTLYEEMLDEQLSKAIEEVQALSAKHLKTYLREQRPDIPKHLHRKMIDDQAEQIERVYKLPLLSQKEIANHIESSYLHPKLLASLASDEDSYLLVTYSAEWCKPCHDLSRDLLTYFQKKEDDLDVNWVKLNK